MRGTGHPAVDGEVITNNKLYICQHSGIVELCNVVEIQLMFVCVVLFNMLFACL
jgi:hypothetical protein